MPLTASEQNRLAAVEAKCAQLELRLAEMAAGVRFARWIAGLAISLLTIFVGIGR